MSTTFPSLVPGDYGFQRETLAQDLRTEAAAWAANGEHPVDAAQWSLEALPRELFFGILTPQGWARWLTEEHQWHTGEGRMGYLHMVNERIREPVCVLIVDGEPVIWDGWHRTAAAIVGAHPFVPAVVGRLSAHPCS